MKSSNLSIVLAFILCTVCLVFVSCITEGGNSSGTPKKVEDKKLGEKTAAVKEKAAAVEVLRIKGAEHFKAEVLDYEGVVLVEFTAGWCPPCQRLSPHIDKLAGELKGKLKIVKVYEDEENKPNKDLLTEYKIKAFPTMLIFKSGAEVAREVGYRDYAKLKSWVEEYI
jgi:thioredoxin 1